LAAKLLKRYIVNLQIVNKAIIIAKYIEEDINIILQNKQILILEE